ncbi:MAG: adenosylcobinamide-phosphate synthase CbiB [Prevotella sp.]|nr:adenosylcobinamide-phosphate synthase CbiB [Prevotella sp.]
MTHPLSLLIGWLLDLMVGDPQRLPHPVVWFGKMIAACERKLNTGTNRKLKGALTAVGLILFVFVFTWMLRKVLDTYALYLFDAIAIFYGLAGTTLIREVRAVFLALDRSLDEGRRQVARIVGRDTSELSAQEVRTAALETLAENLSDGVIAPLFWLAILGTPGMLAYKMVNTLDSMVGYKTDRYRDFGCWAAHIDDIANYIPARLTAFLMVLPRLVTINTHGGSKFLRPSGSKRTKFERFTFHSSLFTFVRTNGRCHASPNSGYPEAALAAILDCRFGGPHYYFGELFDKPYIGTNGRPLTTEDMRKAVRVNRTAEVLMVAIVLLCQLPFFL